MRGHRVVGIPHGPPDVGQRRRPARGRVGGQDRPHRDLEGAGRGPAHGPADQHRRRRPGGPARARRRAPRGLRLPAPLVPVLGARARPRRLHARPVRRELHRRGARGRRGVHRRPLPDRRRALRGHPAARHVLPRRHPDGRARDAVAARRPPPPGLLPPRARGGDGRGRRGDRQGRRRTGAADGRAGRRAALPPGQAAGAARAGAAGAGAERGLAGQLPGAARAARSRRARVARLPAAPRGRDPARERERQLLRARPGGRRRRRRPPPRPGSTSRCGCARRTAPRR